MLTLAALFSHATVALNSVAGEDVDFALATSNISPTMIVASSQSILKYHDGIMKSQTGLLSKLSRYWQNKSLINGNMPKMPSFVPPSRHDSLSKLRLLLIYHRAEHKDSTCLSTTTLANLKILLGARTCYALTASAVAGAVCQTNMFDYRQTSARGSHFGPPLSCVEVLLKGDEDDEKLGSSEPQGKVSHVLLPALDLFGANRWRLWFEGRRYVVVRSNWILLGGWAWIIHCRCLEVRRLSSKCANQMTWPDE